MSLTVMFDQQIDGRWQYQCSQGSRLLLCGVADSLDSAMKEMMHGIQLWSEQTVRAWIPDVCTKYMH